MTIYLIGIAISHILAVLLFLFTTVVLWKNYRDEKDHERTP